ncbi:MULTISPECIES: NUDIX hydrolase [Bacillaceae]|uniref:NUDIX domain-containing protein n=1 Tax=Evansella alkalicola TaxID=745819 RepID=A0ABS6JS16_9BACI|nr:MULTISPECIES: NUDIX domain-containing protein [Bacillaceae]MBU9721278.1 NUDIX domain-containing protein [Bacillus alkalicola]
MLFHQVFDDTQTNHNQMKVKTRQAVRAVIVMRGKILLVRSNRGDFKFPGGGIEMGESHSAALQREIAEETGYINCVVKGKIGAVLERKIDVYDQDTIFEMDSHYYICECSGDRGNQDLDGYEAEQGFTPVWISFDDAIKQNDEASRQLNCNGWVRRETFVLKNLREYFK